MATSKWILAGVGVFTIPIKMVTVSKETESNIKQIHADGVCGGRLGRAITCKKCLKTVPNDQVGIAFAQSKKEVDGVPVVPDIPTTKDELALMRPKDFIPGVMQVVAIIDPLPTKYYNGQHRIIVPQEKNALIASNLALFFNGLHSMKQVAFVKYFDMGNVYFATIDAQGNMDNLYFAEEVDTEENESLAMVAASTIDTAHSTLMVQILKAMKKKQTFDIATTMKDVQTENRANLMMEKLTTGKMTLPTTAPAPVVNAAADQMAALQASLAAAGEDTAAAPVAPAAPVKAKKAAKKA
jgi:non-homologous end joining protein Ku